MSILSEVEDELIPELPRFFENYYDDIEQLKEALKNRNADEITSTSHRIKGSSGSWGFQSIQDIAVKLEQAGKDHNWEAVQSNLETLEQRIDEAHDAVQDALENDD